MLITRALPGTVIIRIHWAARTHVWGHSVKVNSRSIKFFDPIQPALAILPSACLSRVSFLSSVPLACSCLVFDPPRSLKFKISNELPRLAIDISHTEQIFVRPTGSCSWSGCLCMWFFYVCKRTRDTGNISSMGKDLKKITRDKIIVAKLNATVWSVN